MDQESTPQQQAIPPVALLPHELLAFILQIVPQAERLQHCAVVCRAWAGAAAAATTSITLKAPPGAKVLALNAWLGHHGNRLSFVQLTSNSHYISTSVPLQLPCAELSLLTKLDIAALRVELQLQDSTAPDSSAGSVSPGATRTAVLPSLRELRLADCTFTSSAALLQLPAVPGVTRLELEGTPTANRDHLYDANSNAALNLVHSLPGLAELSVCRMRDAAAAAELVEVAPSSLTNLKVRAQSSSLYTTAACLPCSAQHLQQLQRLTLEFAVLHPAVLASMPQLLWLELESCRMLPPEQGGGRAEGATAFLTALRSLQQLQHLMVSDGEVPSPPYGLVLSELQPQDCAALTASDSLTHLQLCTNPFEAQLLPVGAVQHMFPAGRQLAQLRVLDLASGMWEALSAYMSAADLRCILSACPALSSLDITGALRPGEAVAALLQLPPSCQALQIGGDVFDDQAAATVAQLTQLTSLKWMASNKLTDAGLDQLTALRGLQALALHYQGGLSTEVSGSINGFMESPIELKACNSKCCPHCSKVDPVWQQLQDLLAKSPSNTGWRRRLAQQQRSTRRLQQQAAQLQQQAADLESYMDSALVVMTSCSPDYVSKVQAMCELACTALCSSTASVAAGCAGDASSSDSEEEEEEQPAAEGCAAIGVGMEAAAAAEAALQDPEEWPEAMQRYLGLQQQVLGSCAGGSTIVQAIDAMQAIAVRAFQQQQQQQQQQQP